MIRPHYFDLVGSGGCFRAMAGPAAITNTPRDEFAPSVSPDGKQLAHVSNYLGKLDLFVMPLPAYAGKLNQLLAMRRIPATAGPPERFRHAA